MIPETYNFEIHQGSTFITTFTVDADSEIDFASYSSIRMQIRKSPESAVLWDSAENAGSLTKVDSKNIRISLTAAQTAALDFIEAGYDIELVTSAGTPVVDKWLTGTITLIKEYTK